MLGAQSSRGSVWPRRARAFGCTASMRRFEISAPGDLLQSDMIVSSCPGVTVPGVRDTYAFSLALGWLPNSEAVLPGGEMKLEIPVGRNRNARSIVDALGREPVRGLTIALEAVRTTSTGTRCTKEHKRGSFTVFNDGRNQRRQGEICMSEQMLSG